MTEHEEHEEHAERLEREADQLQKQSDQIADDIEAAREDWTGKQRDDRVPGATGEPRDPDEEKPWPDE
jgi:chromosome segregation ATPase